MGVGCDEDTTGTRGEQGQGTPSRSSDDTDKPFELALLSVDRERLAGDKKPVNGGSNKHVQQTSNPLSHRECPGRHCYI